LEDDVTALSIQNAAMLDDSKNTDQSAAHAPSKAKVWTGRVLSGLVVAFMTMDAVMKLIKATPAVEGTIKVGYSADVVFPLGAILAVCVVLYAIPRTAALGAILLTGYLGGAVATHVRAGDSLFGHILFPVYFGVLLWAGLYLRDADVRRLFLRDAR
jgi:hypothetical protein